VSDAETIPRRRLPSILRGVVLVIIAVAVLLVTLANERFLYGE
jgi:hypothetical protein